MLGPVFTCDQLRVVEFVSLALESLFPRLETAVRVRLVSMCFVVHAGDLVPLLAEEVVFVLDAAVDAVEEVVLIGDHLLEQKDLVCRVLVLFVIVHALEMVPAVTAVALEHFCLRVEFFLGVEPLAPAVEFVIHHV